MLTEKGFEILLASPPEYERLVAEIYFDGLFVGMVTEEKAVGVYQLEMPNAVESESQIVRRVDLPGFIEAARKACQQLAAK